MKQHAIAVLYGFVGVLLALGGWHLYRDHVLIDAIRADLQRKQMAAPAPQPTVTPRAPEVK